MVRLRYVALVSLIVVVVTTAAAVVFAAHQTHSPSTAHATHRPVYHVQRGSDKLPKGGDLAAARAALARLPKGKLPPVVRSVAPPSTLLNPSGDWISQGPTPMSAPGEYWSGRITALAVDQTTSGSHTIIYLGAASGGVWKSDNNGASWTPLTDQQATLTTGAIAIDPTNHNIIYVGTGEPNQSGDSYSGTGILKSTDGGAHWTLQGASMFNGADFTDIYVCPTNNQLVFASSTFGLYYTVNGGSSWSLVKNGMPNGGFNDVDALVANTSTSPATLLATIRGAGLYRSTNGGGTWGLVSSGLPSASGWDGRSALAIAASNQSVAYVVITTPAGDVYISGTYNGGYYTTDGGVSWSQMTSLNYDFTNVPFSAGPQGWFDIYLGVDPKNDEIVYGGGEDIAISPDARGASGDWTDIGGYDGNGLIHPDQHAIAFPACSAAPCPAYFGNDGGLWLGTNTTSTPSYTDLNTPNLSTIQFYGGDLNSNYVDPHQLLAGSQDNGTALFTTNHVWPQVWGGDGAYSQIDPTNANTLYAENTYISLIKSTDGGNSWNGATSGIGGTSNFYMPYVLDHASPSHLAAGTSAIYESNDGASSWYQGSQTFGGSVSFVTISPANSHIIYTIADQGYRTTTGDAGSQQTYTALASLGGPFPAAYVLDPTDTAGNTVFALSNSAIYKSTNGGVTSWTDISTGLGSQYFGFQTGLIYYSGSTRVLVVSGLSGTIFTTNDGATWNQLQQNLPNVVVDQLAMDKSETTIAAFTHGRGAWTIDIPQSTGGTGDTEGVYEPSVNTFYLHNTLGPGSYNEKVPYGLSGDIPITGDWTGAGKATVGVYRPSDASFHLFGSNGKTLYTFTFGSPNEIPIVGDWTGTGHDSVGVYNPSTGTFSLRVALSSGPADFTMIYGGTGFLPVAGDWNGDGIDSIGVYKPSDGSFHLTNQVCTCGVTTNYTFTFGAPNQQPVIGDWTHAGHDGVGVFDASTRIWNLRNDGTSGGAADFTFSYGGPSNAMPVAGHWT
jgi:hypothetical protein